MFGLDSIAPVYLDNAASTPVDPVVVEAMHQCLHDARGFANPSSLSHAYGQTAHSYITDAATALGEALGVSPQTLIWTSGATESDNLAIIGAANYRADKGRHLITSRVEHKAVLDAFAHLEANGFDVTWLAPDEAGRISAQAVADALREDTTLVSVMWVNNELGVINDIPAIARVLASHPALLHVDAAQAFGKLPIDLGAVAIDLLSLTAHKAYGPKGIGALYVAPREGVNIAPMLFGGGQQNGLRPGTLATHQIVGFGAAARLVSARLNADSAHLQALGEALQQRLLAVPGVRLNGAHAERLPGIVNVSVEGVNGSALVAAMQPVALATGSACNSTHTEPSFVLKALGHSDALAESSLRFSAGRFTTDADVQLAAGRFEQAVALLRRIAGPLAGASS